jgi:hypothetical protein
MSIGVAIIAVCSVIACCLGSVLGFVVALVTR